MKTITFFYDVISPYAHLAFEAWPQAMAGLGHRVRHVPVLFAGVLAHHGQLRPAQPALQPPGPGPGLDLRMGRRVVGLGLLLVLCFKVASEDPFGPAVRAVEGWDIAVAPVAHACGVAAGLLAGVLVEAVSAWRDRRHRAAATLGA